MKSGTKTKTTEEKIAEFLANGGTIERCPDGPTPRTQQIRGSKNASRRGINPKRRYGSKATKRHIEQLKKAR